MSLDQILIWLKSKVGLKCTSDMWQFWYIFLSILGHSTNEEWSSTLKKHPAPWGELRIPGFLTITFPSSKMRKIDNMEEVAKFYAKAMKYFVKLIGTSKAPREERLVFDNQIAKGNIK